MLDLILKMPETQVHKEVDCHEVFEDCLLCERLEKSPEYFHGTPERTHPEIVDEVLELALVLWSLRSRYSAFMARQFSNIDNQHAFVVLFTSSAP
jgi:hypothetical protein